MNDSRLLWNWKWLLPLLSFLSELVRSESSSPNLSICNYFTVKVSFIWLFSLLVSDLLGLLDWLSLYLLPLLRLCSFYFRLYYFFLDNETMGDLSCHTWSICCLPVLFIIRLIVSNLVPITKLLRKCCSLRTGLAHYWWINDDDDVFLVAKPGRNAQIMRWCGIEQICCSNPVPISDSGQPRPRLWGPNSHSLSPTRRSSLPMTRDEWNKYNRQQAKDIHRGHQYMGLSVTSCVDDEVPRFYVTEHHKRPLPGSVRIRYRAWAWTRCNLSFRKFSGFRNCGIKLVTPIKFKFTIKDVF